MPRPAVSTALILLLLAPAASAEIYRWVDEHGRVHFSDRAPADKNRAEQQQLRPINISDAEPTQDYGEPFPASEAEMHIDEQREISQRRRQQDIQQQCDRARQRLRNLSRPVTFIDDDGSEFDISEQERAELERQLRRNIANNCS